MSVTTILLAADRGEGFSGPKYLTAVRGRTIIERTLEDVGGWPVDQIVVVLGADADAILDEAAVEGADVIVDPEWEEGLAASLRAALDLIESDVAASHVVVARGDQPGVDASVVSALIDRAVTSGADAVVPKYRYARGWPIVLSRSAWQAFLAREGPLDLHSVAATHPETTVEVWVDRLAPAVYANASDIPAGR